MSHHIHQKKNPDAYASTPDANPDTNVAKEGLGQPTSEDIRVRAYEISQTRNGGPGDAMADWIQAEQEASTGRDAGL